MALKPIFGALNNEDLQENFEYLEGLANSQQSQINSNDSDISALQAKTNQHDVDVSNLNISVNSKASQESLTNTKNNLQEQINLNKQGIINVNERIDNLIIESGDTNQEVIDARGGYTTLKNRLDNDKRYLWIEEKTVSIGDNSFTLVNSVASGQKLKIIDKFYSIEWLEDTHWTREGQIITFTEEEFDEELTFEIMNLG